MCMRAVGVTNTRIYMQFEASIRDSRKYDFNMSH